MAAALRCHPHTQVRCSRGRPAASAPPAGLDERKQIYPFVRALDSWLPLCSGSRPRDDREYVVDHPPAMLPRLLAPHTPRVLGAAHTRSRLPPYLPPARSRIPSMPKTPRSSAVASKHGRAIIYAPSVQPAQVRLGHVVSLLNQPGASPKAASRWLPQHMALRQRRWLYEHQPSRASTSAATSSTVAADTPSPTGSTAPRVGTRAFLAHAPRSHKLRNVLCVFPPQQKNTNCILVCGLLRRARI